MHKLYDPDKLRIHFIGNNFYLRYTFCAAQLIDIVHLILIRLKEKTIGVILNLVYIISNFDYIAPFTIFLKNRNGNNNK